MRKITAAALVIASAMLTAAAKPPAPAKPAPAHATKPAAKAAQPKEADFNSPKTYPLGQIEFPGGVEMTTLVYSQLTGFRPLTLDLYLPRAQPGQRPVVVFVHGGNWNSGDSRHTGTFGDFPGLLASIAARGFVVASVNYRLSGEAHFPAALQDVKTAIRWLRLHASDYNLDDTRIAIWGASAGGHLAAMAGVTCGVAALEPAADPKNPRPPSDCVEAVIDWYGITDLESLDTDFGKKPADKSAAGDFLGCEPALCPIGVAHNSSPLTYIESMAPPFLIMHGDADITVSPKQSQRLYDALRAKDVPAELVNYPGVAHGFVPADNSTPGAFDAATNREAVAKLESFLDATFPKKPVTPAAKPVKAKTRP